MSKSLILSRLGGVGKAVARCYDGSRLEKLYARFYAYWVKKARSSAILSFLRERFMIGQAVQDSAALRLIRLPVTLSRRFYGKHQAAFSQIKAQSVLYAALSSPGNVTARSVGFTLLAFAAGLFPWLFLRAHTALSSAATALFIVASMVLCAFDVPLGTIIGSGLTGTFVRKYLLLCDDSEVERIPVALSPRICWPVAFLFGLSSFFCGGIGAMLLLCGVTLLLLIAAKPFRGVCLLVPLAAVLPTMALVGLALFCAFAAVLHLLLGKTPVRGASPFALWIAAFSVLSLCAVLGGAAPASGLKIYLVYLSFALAFPLIVYTVRDKRDYTRLLTLLCTAAFGVALYGVFQNFFLRDTTQSWVDSTMFSEIEKRVYSTLDNPNVLGEYLILTVPLAASVLLYCRRPVSKLWYTAVNLTMLLCLMYTWSRGAWVGVVLALGFFLLQKDRRFLIPCLVILLLMPSVMPASVLHRLTSIGNMNDTSTAYRVSVWQGSIRIIRDYGLLGGIGLGSDAFLKIYPHYALNGAEYALHSHNFYLQWIVDMGWLGIVVYFGLILTAFSCILRAKKNTDPKKIAALAMSGGLCGYLFHGMAENLWYNYRMVLVFFIYLALICLASYDENNPCACSEETVCRNIT